jgi:hypothetical protein
MKCVFSGLSLLTEEIVVRFLIKGRIVAFPVACIRDHKSKLFTLKQMAYFFNALNLKGFMWVSAL